MAFKHYTTDYVNQIVHEFENSGESKVNFAREHGISPTTLTNWLSTSGGKEPAIEQNHPYPDFMKKLDKKIDVVDVLQKLAERTESHNEPDKDYCKIAIKTDKPVCVLMAADLHLGGLDVNYQSLLEHYQFLLNEDRFYLQLFGDSINMMIMHKTTAARHDVLTPDEQCDLLVGMADGLLANGKLLSACWGNHDDEFTERSAGFGLTKLLLSKKVPYFSAMGYIDLVVGSQTYGEAFTHKTRFNSFMNALHGAKRMQQCHAEYFGVNRSIAKCYITAHTHNPAVSFEGCVPEERIYFLRCGTFKTEDLYSRRYFGKGRIGVPSAVFFPDRQEHIVLPTPWDAYRFITGKDAPGLRNSEKK